MARIVALTQALALASLAASSAATVDDAGVLVATDLRTLLAVECVECPRLPIGRPSPAQDGDKEGSLFFNASVAADGRTLLLNNIAVYPDYVARGLSPQIPHAAQIPTALGPSTLEEWERFNFSAGGIESAPLSYDHAIRPAREEGDAIITFDVLEWGHVQLNAPGQQILEITVQRRDSGLRIVHARTPVRTQRGEFDEEPLPAWCPAWIPSFWKQLRYFFSSTPTPPDPPGHTIVRHSEWDSYGRKGTINHLFNKVRYILGFTWPLVCVAIGLMFVAFFFLRQRFSAWWQYRFQRQIATVREAKERRARWRREEAERRLMMQEADLDGEEEGLLGDFDDGFGVSPTEITVYRDKGLPPLPPRPEDKDLPLTPAELKPLPPLPPPSPQPPRR